MLYFLHQVGCPDTGAGGKGGVPGVTTGTSDNPVATVVSGVVRSRVRNRVGALNPFK
jgi:hypothetical protein